jgi:hypothetical protein
MDNLISGIFGQGQQQPGSAGPPTPQQIQAAYAYANTLKSQGIQPSQPVKSWTQGVNQMLQALLGNRAGNQADQMQRQLNQAQAGAIPGAAPYMPMTATQLPPPTTPAQLPPPATSYPYNGVSPQGIGGQ